MREIKFRAWDHGTNTWHDFNENDFKFSPTPPMNILLMRSMDGQCELEQFTGLTDKNGVEIFEGDIVLCNPDKIVAWWDKTKMTFPESFATVGDFELVEHTNDFKLMPFHCESNIDDGCYNESRYFQIIGNIHKNKEFKTLGYIYGFEPQS